jgi:hypothetical protein
VQVPSEVGQGLGSKTPVLFENPGTAHKCAARAVLENNEVSRTRHGFLAWFLKSVQSGHLFFLFWSFSADVFVVIFGMFGTVFGMVLARGGCLILVSGDCLGE